VSAERIADLERRLAAREGRPGYKRNVQHIQGELARLRRDADQATVR